MNASVSLNCASKISVIELYIPVYQCVVPISKRKAAKGVIIKHTTEIANRLMVSNKGKHITMCYIV